MGNLEPFKILGTVPAGACPECATEHEDWMPHNLQSLYYNYKFFDANGYWPTWADAMAHCTEEVKQVTKEALKKIRKGC